MTTFKTHLTRRILLLLAHVSVGTDALPSSPMILIDVKIWIGVATSMNRPLATLTVASVAIAQSTTGCRSPSVSTRSSSVTRHELSEESKKVLRVDLESSHSNPARTARSETQSSHSDLQPASPLVVCVKLLAVFRLVLLCQRQISHKTLSRKRKHYRFNLV